MCNCRLRDLEVPEVVEEETAKPGQSEEEDFKPLTFTDVYCVNGATQDLFKDAGLWCVLSFVMCYHLLCVHNV